MSSPTAGTLDHRIGLWRSAPGGVERHSAARPSAPARTLSASPPRASASCHRSQPDRRCLV